MQTTASAAPLSPQTLCQFQQFEFIESARLAFGSEREGQKESDGQPKGGSQPARTGKPRILIVDDHDLVRDGLAALLDARWDVCGEAGNGIEAIEKVRELKPDLVLLDLSMPLMTGTQAARRIRALSPGTKIVFLSMHDSPTVAELVKTVGADGFISKHSNAEEFRAALATLLHHVQ